MATILELFLLIIAYHLAQIILLSLLVILAVHSNLTETFRNNLRCFGFTKSYLIPFDDTHRSIYLVYLFPY